MLRLSSVGDLEDEGKRGPGDLDCVLAGGHKLPDGSKTLLRPNRP